MGCTITAEAAGVALLVGGSVQRVEYISQINNYL
jgi:hypothetical protein